MKLLPLSGILTWQKVYSRITYEKLDFVYFDFENSDSIRDSTQNIDGDFSILLNRFYDFKNQAIELTGYENENFFKVVDLINASISKPIHLVN